MSPTQAIALVLALTLAKYASSAAGRPRVIIVRGGTSGKHISIVFIYIAQPSATSADGRTYA
jgi:hypothetical protein